jgi:DNA-binding transcriptional LysR family regulator
MLLEEAVPTYHVSGTPCTLLEEGERLASYLTKMLQHIRNVLQVT